MIPLFALWALAGWCGSEPRRIKLPPGVGPPPPDPEPWWLVSRIIGVLAGIIGGLAYTKVFGPHPEPWSQALPAAVSSVGAFLLASFATDVYGKIAGPRNAAGG